MWRQAALVTTLIAQLIWVGLCLQRHPSQIEESLAAASMRDLSAAGFADVEIRFQGRDAELKGTVDTPDRGLDIERRIRSIPGVRKVVSRLIVEPEAGPTPVLPYLEIHARPGSVVLLGSVPSAAQRQDVVQKAVELFGEEQVDDRLVVDEAAEDGVAMAHATDFVAIAWQAMSGTQSNPPAGDVAFSNLVVRLRGEGLRLSGRVGSQEARRRIESQARAAAPDARVFFSALEVSDAPRIQREPVDESKRPSAGQGAS